MYRIDGDDAGGNCTNAGLYGQQPSRTHSTYDSPSDPFVAQPALLGNLLRDHLKPIHGVPSAAQAKNRYHNAELQRLQTTFPIGRNEAVRAAYLAPKDWECRKSELKRLYLDENQSLKDTREIMEQRGFQAR